LDPKRIFLRTVSKKVVIPAKAEILRGYIILRFQSDALDEFETMG